MTNVVTQNIAATARRTNENIAVLIGAMGLGLVAAIAALAVNAPF